MLRLFSKRESDLCSKGRFMKKENKKYYAE